MLTYINPHIEKKHLTCIIFHWLFPPLKKHKSCTASKKRKLNNELIFFDIIFKYISSIKKKISYYEITKTWFCRFNKNSIFHWVFSLITA